jgi:predicted Fe-S protein YdhL (DUF1289 family)
MTDVPRGTTFRGSVCAKHPEMHGLRYLNNRVCYGCARDRGKSNWQQLREKVEVMENLLTEWQQVGGPQDLLAKTQETLAKRDKLCPKCGRKCSTCAHFCRGCGEMI